MGFSVPFTWIERIKKIVPTKAVLSAKTFFREQNAWHAVLSLSLGVFAVCSGILFYRLYVLPGRTDASLADARSLYRGFSSAPQSSSAGSSAPPQKQDEYTFSKLQALNPDVKGWITIPGTAVDYPVLCPPADSPDYYLAHDWKRGASKYGSIYMFPADPKQKNIILYGHSMKDGRMFAPLLQYARPDFYSLHPTIQFRQGSGTACWKVFAVIKANTDPSQGQPFDYQKTRFASSKAFSDYLGQVRARSVLSLPVDLKTSDFLLTLSTCSYEFDGFRTVVFARRVRPGENADVDIPRVSANGKALYPDCWYQKFGGEKP